MQEETHRTTTILLHPETKTNIYLLVQDYNLLNQSTKVILYRKSNSKASQMDKHHLSQQRATVIPPNSCSAPDNVARIKRSLNLYLLIQNQV